MWNNNKSCVAFLIVLSITSVRGVIKKFSA